MITMIVAMAGFGILLVKVYFLNEYDPKIWRITARTLLVIAAVEIIFGVFTHSTYFVIYGGLCVICALALFKMIDRVKKLMPELISVRGSEITIRVLPRTKYPPD